MTTFYRQQGNSFMIYGKEQFQIVEKLPPKVFKIDQLPFGGPLYLNIVPDFGLPDRVYGDVKNRAKRVLNTFHDRENSTGVMAIGMKGSGKTLLAKQISALASNQGIPTILVNESWDIEPFVNLLQSIEQPIIILFDEFEKNFRSNRNNDDLPPEQEKLLSVLDGVNSSSKKLFIFTINNKYEISDFLINRPGRIFYRFDYSNVDRLVVREYLEENLKREYHHKIETIVKLCVFLVDFNFDILQAIVEEINRYGESPSEVLKYLNIENASIGGVYEIEVYKNECMFHSGRNRINPFSFHFDIPSKDPNTEEVEEVITFDQEDIIKTDTESGKIFAEFKDENNDEFKLIATPIINKDKTWFENI